jgi:diguanylate cyclase (GGDEF)-like protein/PAS domain S-box-containing protein
MAARGGKGLGVSALLLIVLAWAGTPATATPPTAAPAAPASASRADTVERDPLETRALLEPEAVLHEVVPAIRNARIANDHRRLALLYLAQANACRVVADWNCQREAGLQARAEARQANAPQLEARGLIAESRARIAMQDYTRGERLLGEAEVLLKASPQPELLADVFLAYSSMSYSLGKHALAAQYAERGLALLAEGEGLTMQARLQRNLARALSQTGRIDEAGDALAEATRLAERLSDPKLGAELYLEAARLARIAGDQTTQRVNGERILVLADRLKNSQLAGLGHEVLGLAAADAGDGDTALRELRAAQQSFRSLELVSDELRVLRELVGFLLRERPSSADLPPLFERFLALDNTLAQNERAQAADDFDARLKYAERENEILRLQAETTLAGERERALAESNRLSRTLMALGILTLIVLAVFFVVQRRSHRRLQGVLAKLGESELQYRTLAENSSDLVVRMQFDGRRLYVSPSTRELLGFEPEELMQPRWELVHPDDRERLRQAIEALARDGGSTTVVYRAQHRHGHYVWIEALARRVTGPEGLPEILYTGRDISTRVRAEQALAAIQARLRAVTDNIPAMIAHIDTQERYTFANGHSGRILSKLPDAVIGRTVREVRGEAIYSEIKGHIAAALRGERVTFEGQAEVDGQTRHYQTSYVPDVGADGKVQGYFSFIFDITQLKTAERELERQARIDGLTGVANRRYFDERLASGVARGRRSGAPIALLYLDIDRFKAINDGRGHAGGDQVLREFARRLKSNVREGDLVARIGGDEFVVLVEGAESLAGVQALAAKLLRAIESPFELPGGPLAVGTSIGLAYSRRSVNADRLLTAADQALYLAKDAGRATWRAVELD